MIGRLPQICKSAAHFLAKQDGVAMTEAVVVVPFLTLFAVGVLEFGALFWQREQIETGLRDAARYMTRCRHATTVCETTARNLAYYGSSASTPRLRVPSWDAANSPINFTTTVPVPTQVIMTASTTHGLTNSPLFGLFGFNAISISASHNQRVIGW